MSNLLLSLLYNGWNVVIEIVESHWSLYPMHKAICVKDGATHEFYFYCR